jgi:N-acetylglucosamine kinase-like BadF-type ATPase
MNECVEISLAGDGQSQSRRSRRKVGIEFAWHLRLRPYAQSALYGGVLMHEGLYFLPGPGAGMWMGQDGGKDPRAAP